MELTTIPIIIYPISVVVCLLLFSYLLWHVVYVDNRDVTVRDLLTCIGLGVVPIINILLIISLVAFIIKVESNRVIIRKKRQ